MDLQQIDEDEYNQSDSSSDLGEELFRDIEVFTDSDEGDNDAPTVEIQEGSVYQKRDANFKSLVASKMSKKSGMTLKSA